MKEWAILKMLPTDCLQGRCGRLLTEHDMIFYLKGDMSGPGISVRRAMSWVLGPAQVEGQGTDGLQCGIPMF